MLKLVRLLSSLRGGGGGGGGQPCDHDVTLMAAVTPTAAADLKCESCQCAGRKWRGVFLLRASLNQKLQTRVALALTHKKDVPASRRPTHLFSSHRLQVRSTPSHPGRPRLAPLFSRRLL